MIRGLYTAATGMIHQRNKLNTIANNLSNIETKGYKKDDVTSQSFKDELLLRIGDSNGNPKRLGFINHGVEVGEVITLFRDGPLEQTNEMTDIALQGEGFFTILRNGESFYTRDGTFKINEEGILTTLQGDMVAGQYGRPIEVGHQEFRIDDLGNIWQNGNIINRLELTSFDDPSLLEKIGDNLFANNDAGSNPELVFEGQVFQGFLEGSNADLVGEISEMIAVARTYEANQRILQMMDHTLSKTVNELGSV